MAKGQQPLHFERWTDNDKQKLALLMSDEVDMADTYYGREQALQERELEVQIDMANAVTSVSFPSLSAETMSEEVEEGFA